MKRLAVLIAAQLIALSAAAADAPKSCSLCVGAVADLSRPLATNAPLLVETTLDGLPALSPVLDALTPEQRRNVSLSVRYTVEGTDALMDVEQKTKSIIQWAQAHGPLDSLGVDARHSDPAIVAYAVKRLSVLAQGENVARSIVLARMPFQDVKTLHENGANAYFDALLVDGANVAATAAWLLENDPVKKIYAVVAPQSPNPMYDLAQALSQGATRAYFAGPVNPDALANVNAAFTGDFAFDATSKSTVLDVKGNVTPDPVLTFIRGEDLRAVVVPHGESTSASIVAIPSDQFEKPRRVDASGQKAITDTGKKGGKLLVGLQPGNDPFVLIVDRAEKPQQSVTKESIDIATKRGITVEEIIRNHQAYDAFQEGVRPSYIARNTTRLRFDIGGGADSLEATIAGDYFADASGRSDWVWQDFLINGVKWKYGRIPELPLIQPEKVTQLPLQLHLTNDYRYQLVGESDILGYHTYEVRFAPPPNAPAALPLYRGTVWIDSKSWARIQISMIQLNLSGEVLSNEELVSFQPFARDTYEELTPADVARRDPREIVWLTRSVAAQQVISAAGRGSAVQRTTDFTNFRINPPDFQTRLKEASASDARMVRETPEAGLKYLEKRGSGERVVKEGFDTARTFLLGGIHHDAGLEYPVVPLGGIDYFNFDLGHRGIQTNVFFAGVVVAANATNPDVAHTRTNVGADFFGIALPTTNSIYRNGVEQKGEAVKSLPTNLTLRAGHPVFGFGKIDLSFGLSHTTYQRSEDTATGFEVPADTFEIGPSIEAQYARWGYTATAFYDYRTRTSWRPWGNLAEYDPSQKTYATFGGSFGKSFFLPKFQRITVALNYLDGQRLDRFSKYGLGFFGAQRVHGVKSGSVQAERAILGHLSYGFVFSDQFRMEAFYDQALLDDTVSGYKRTPMQGVGIAGQTVGPYGTLLRLDIGKTVGQNRQSGFVANVVFLKLF